MCLFSLVNVPSFFEDIARQLAGSTYAVQVSAVANHPFWSKAVGCAEIALGVYWVCPMFGISLADGSSAGGGSGRTALLLPFFYWQWLRLRAMLGLDARQG